MSAEEVNMNRSFDTDWWIRDEKNLCQDVAKEPHTATAGCAFYCADLLEQVEADPWIMDRVITGDESWFFHYDPETKRQSLE